MHLRQPTKQSKTHKTEVHQMRLEREVEDQHLEKLKASLQEKITN
jgi:hypothetical protein